MKRAIVIFIVLLAAVICAACDALPVAAPTGASTAMPPAPVTMPSTSIPPTTLAPATQPPALPPPATTVVPARTDTVPAPQALTLCPILATRTPPPGAPTYIPGGPNPPRGPVDPHIEVCGSALTIRVGETITLTAKPVDIGLPYFMLGVKDDEQTSYTQIVLVTYDNRIQGPTHASALFELVSARGSISEATFVLRALHAGTATIGVSATGEIHYGYPGPATWAGGSADPAVVQIVDK